MNVRLDIVQILIDPLPDAFDGVNDVLGGDDRDAPLSHALPDGPEHAGLVLPPHLLHLLQQHIPGTLLQPLLQQEAHSGHKGGEGASQGGGGGSADL